MIDTIKPILETIIMSIFQKEKHSIWKIEMMIECFSFWELRVFIYSLAFRAIYTHYLYGSPTLIFDVKSIIIEYIRYWKLFKTRIANSPKRKLSLTQIILFFDIKTGDTHSIRWNNTVDYFHWNMLSQKLQISKMENSSFRKNHILRNYFPIILQKWNLFPEIILKTWKSIHMKLKP